MKNLVRLALTAIFVVACMISTVVEAKTYVESTKEYASIGVKRDHNLFVDIYNNPSRYIAIGGGGTGLALYIDKESIDVQQYEPPIYTISFRKIYYSVKTDETVAVGSEIERYKYNYAERKMYFEHRYYDGKIEWDLIDTKKSGTSGARSMISAGEIAFYLAYNMSFYEKPESYYLQEFFKRGEWITFDKE